MIQISICSNRFTRIYIYIIKQKNIAKSVLRFDITSLNDTIFNTFIVLYHVSCNIYSINKMISQYYSLFENHQQLLMLKYLTNFLMYKPRNIDKEYTLVNIDIKHFWYLITFIKVNADLCLGSKGINKFNFSKINLLEEFP